MAKPNQQCTSFLFYLLSWIVYLIFPKQNVTKIFFWRRNIIFGRPLCQGATLDRVKFKVSCCKRQFWQFCSQRWLRARVPPPRPVGFLQVWLSSSNWSSCFSQLVLTKMWPGLMGRGALGGAALSPRALLPERQQPSQVRDRPRGATRHCGEGPQRYTGSINSW